MTKRTTETSPSYPLFDRSRLEIDPLSARVHDLTRDVVMDLSPAETVSEPLSDTAKRIVKARTEGSAVVMMIGGHVIRAGVQRYLIDMMERGFISALCCNGACLIHDYEFALIGATTESVATYIKDGRFGLWRETGHINDIVTATASDGRGLGEGIGADIATGDYPHHDISLFAAAYRLGVPVTVHVGIGYDIVFEHPNCDGAAWGMTSYTDFLSLAAIFENLEGGVVMNFGSAVMAPEVFLKALAMARNVARQKGEEINDFTTLVADLRPPPFREGKEPPKGSAEYYFRPFKTMLVRTVSDGGKSFYAQGDHAVTIPQLWTAVTGESR